MTSPLPSDPRVPVTLLTGFLGGLVSSTAVTLTFAGRSQERPALSRAFATAIIIAWTTMFIRVVVE